MFFVGRDFILMIRYRCHYTTYSYITNVYLHVTDSLARQVAVRVRVDHHKVAAAVHSSRMRVMTMISTARHIIVQLTDFRTELELYNNRFHIWTSVPSGHPLILFSINYDCVRSDVPTSCA